MQPSPNTQFEIDISNYKIIEEIANGGFSIVYKIQEIETGKFYAAKVLQESNQDFIDREVRILMSANNPTIIKFIGYSLHDFSGNDNITIILNYAEKGSLSKLIDTIQFDHDIPEYTNTSRQIILIGIARGMKYLHDRNIIHRDLKNGNILLDENFYPYITDFGLSKFYENDESLIQTMHGGTLSNMAPEMYENDNYDSKIDVYSFAIMMFEIVTNSTAYPELQTKQMNKFLFLVKVAKYNYRPTFKREINKPLQDLIERCWSGNPDERPTFKEIFEYLTNPAFFLDGVDHQKVQEYIEMITKVNDPLEKLLTKFEPVEDLNNQLTEDNKDLINNNIQLAIECEKMKIELNDVKNEIKEAKQLKVMNGKLVDENKQMKAELKQVTNENKNIKAEIKKMVAMHLNLEINHDRLSKEKQQMAGQIKQLTNENKQLSNENKKLISEKETLTTNKDKLIKENKQYEQEIKRLLIENKQLSATNKYLTSQISKLSSDNAKLTSENAILRSQSTGEQKEVKSLKKRTLSFFSFYENSFFNTTSSFDAVNETKTTFSEFNSLPLKSQELLINKTRNQFLKKLNYLIQFLLKYEPLSECLCLQIDVDNNEKYISMVNKDDNVHILSNTTKIVHSNGLLNSKNFINNLKMFDKISIDVTYPSELFQNIYEILLDLRKNYLTKNNFQIGVHISGIQETDYKFINDSEINFIRIDSSVSDIGSSFENCTSVSRVIIPSSIKSIKSDAFKCCSKLSSIIIPSSVQSIEKNAFSSCSSLVSVIFDDNSSLTMICDSTFCDCSSLTTITIPKSVKTIEIDAFNGCSSLTQVIFEDISSIESIGECAFNNCSSLTQIPIPQLNIIKKKTFSRCFLLEQVTIPSSVTLIEESSFAECISLASINLPSSLKSIAPCSFEKCAHLSEVTFETPWSIQVISASLFCDCSSLKSILIPSSVTAIESLAFKGCSSLQIIVFDEKSPLQSIGENAFCGCSSLAEVTIPKKVTIIGKYAFKECTSLTHISLSPCIKSIQEGVFADCSSLKEIGIPEDVIEIGISSFEGCTSLEKVTFEKIPSVASICDRAFCNCSSLLYISIPISVQEIHKCSFKDCSSLIKIEVPSLLNIDDVEFNKKVIIDKI